MRIEYEKGDCATQVVRLSRRYQFNKSKQRGRADHELGFVKKFIAHYEYGS